MILKRVFNNDSNKYENKIQIVNKIDNEINYLERCLKNVSISYILYGVYAIFFNFLKMFLFGRKGEFTSLFKLFFLASGSWSFIIVLQILTFVFFSNFFKNISHLLLNVPKKLKENWNIFYTVIFLTNIIILSCVSILSFYVTFSYTIIPYSINNVELSTSTLFSFSMNLVFIFLQILYILLKLNDVKNIKINYYFPLLLPGFSVMIDLIENKLKNKIREKILLKKKNKKSKRIMKNTLKQDEYLFLIQ